MFGTFSTAENITFAIARESCAPEIAGSAVAINNTLVMFGGMVLQPVVGKFLDHSWSGTMVNGARVFSTTAYQHALVILPIGLALGAILSFFIRETHANFVKS